MAKVISWQLGNKYFYLRGEHTDPVVSTEALPKDSVNALALYWRNKDFPTYKAAFDEIKDLSRDEFGLTT